MDSGLPINPTQRLATSQSAVEVRVLFFAKARELAGASSDTIRVRPGTLPREALQQTIISIYPTLKPLAPYCALAVNLDYVPPEGSGEEQTPLKSGDELAIIPPISGG